ncbi:MAG: ABC transporter ATP-binding protein [Candidatus Lokiarchaeota archaeon]|nr:ABC transporter ATP-binding protein [Candidatus Lokiarchaeota archaeon]
MVEEIIGVENLTKRYISGIIRQKEVYGARDVSFNIKRGEILSLVGESGSGKSTIANMILRLLKPTKGEINLLGKSIREYKIKNYYENVQGIFQDPYSSYNFFYKVDHVLNQAISHSLSWVDIAEKERIIANTLGIVGLRPDETLGRFPHQLSGGQLQRILLARCLLFKPRLLIADEPTSMIDACARAEVLNLLRKLRDKSGISVLFITHDIGQAQYISDRVIVMKQGEIVEGGPTNEVFLNPKEDYTKALLSSVPSIYRRWYT